MRKFWLASIALVLVAGVTSAHTQTYKVLYNLGSKSGDPAEPGFANIVQGRDGNLYSTTNGGGSTGDGAVFKITTGGNLTVLHSFINATDGRFPAGGLILGSDGHFYGTTASGGINSFGTMFKTTSGGALTTLHFFAGGTDGMDPTAAPIQGMDGNFYGTTVFGGASQGSGWGTVYKITPSGAYKKLHGFTPRRGEPEAPLIQGIDGKFYGTAFENLIFRVTELGDFKELFDFGFNPQDGYIPIGPLVQGGDGNFYGTTSQGGSGVNGGQGVVFKMTPAGTLAVLYKFTGQGDEEYPVGGLVQATDGNFYGTTSGNQSADCGTIFRITSAGNFTTLYTFPGDRSTGCRSNGPLLQQTNGILYGTTQSGGTGNNDGGVIFSLDLGLPPFVRFLPEASRVGQTVGIFGQGLTGTTAVSFNGAPASFTFVSDTYLTASVPSGAATGFVTVTTPSGTLTSNKKFQVRPQVLSFSPASGPVGTSVVITGVSLGGATRVTFGSTQTSFTQNSDTQVTATVPSGALTGHIGVTTTGAASYGQTAFTVTP